MNTNHSSRRINSVIPKGKLSLLTTDDDASALSYVHPVANYYENITAFVITSAHNKIGTREEYKINKTCVYISTVARGNSFLSSR